VRVREDRAASTGSKGAVHWCCSNRETNTANEELTVIDLIWLKKDSLSLIQRCVWAFSGHSASVGIPVLAADN
jgi:hypothetical protein